jgi:hypothetical protein
MSKPIIGNYFRNAEAGVIQLKTNAVGQGNYALD